jgi:hypothetical protein
MTDLPQFVPARLAYALERRRVADRLLLKILKLGEHGRGPAQRRAALLLDPTEPLVELADQSISAGLSITSSS